MKAVPERKFLKMLRDEGCISTTTGSNEHAIWYQGKLVSVYGVWHSKGSKREVGMIYVKQFLRQISEIKAAERPGKGKETC